MGTSSRQRGRARGAWCVDMSRWRPRARQAVAAAHSMIYRCDARNTAGPRCPLRRLC